MTAAAAAGKAAAVAVTAAAVAGTAAAVAETAAAAAVTAAVALCGGFLMAAVALGRVMPAVEMMLVD